LKSKILKYKKLIITFNIFFKYNTFRVQSSSEMKVTSMSGSSGTPDWVSTVTSLFRGHGLLGNKSSSEISSVNGLQPTIFQGNEFLGNSWFTDDKLAISKEFCALELQCFLVVCG